MMKKLFLLMGIVILCGTKSFSQLDFAQLLEAGVKDANTLALPYLNPYGEMLGASLNNGWYSTAKPHKQWGFDITLTATYVQAPSGKKSFDINDVALNEFELVPGSSSISPTVAGNLDNLPRLRKIGDNTDLSEFEMLNGTGMDYLPIPMVTAGVGLPLGFEVRGRYSPKMEIGEAGRLGVWGIGLQKDIKDYLPGVKDVSVLNVSVLAAYTQFTSEIKMGETYPDGTLDIGSNAFTARLLIGANLSVMSFYTGLGYGKSASDFELLGTYSVSDGIPVVVKDPIKVDYMTETFDMNVGMRIRLGIIAVHVDYTFGEYNALTGGVGINFK